MNISGFEFGKDENGNDLAKTIISCEFSSKWKPGDINCTVLSMTPKTAHFVSSIKALVSAKPKIIFGGWLSEYKCYDTDRFIADVLDRCEKELGEQNGKEKDFDGL